MAKKTMKKIASNLAKLALGAVIDPGAAELVAKGMKKTATPSSTGVGRNTPAPKTSSARKATASSSASNSRSGGTSMGATVTKTNRGTGASSTTNKNLRSVSSGKYGSTATPKKTAPKTKMTTGATSSGVRSGGVNRLASNTKRKIY